MCDIRLFKSAYLDYQAAAALYRISVPDEMYFNIVAYHLQQCVEKVIKGALECVGVTVPNTHRITKLLQMVQHNGANITVTEWLDDHAEMLSEWEAESRYNMDFVVEKRKLDRAMRQIEVFLKRNGIDDKLRDELQSIGARERLMSFLPQNLRHSCSDFEMNCYYIMFEKKINNQENIRENKIDESKTGTAETESENL
ncbi:hypothetical protein C823_003241 [Eubacterium plexicaudatum ASF492]|uniref:HEPN domain-containing protein n=1 Tax=Eubacterium plexicaudatum ASF492 TaxID=1235802 RepID=N2AII6_9FIRM|nr:hypothetical protein C823_003241 [Eubacterium plexicaudatum ASF492]